MNMITTGHNEFYAKCGYIVIRQLFSEAEAAAYRDHFMELRKSGSYPGDLAAQTEKPNDPLIRYPRMKNMHHWDEVALQWVLDERFRLCLTALLGAEPAVAQTMLYFKPPGARGQAVHQDNIYLQVKPGTCMAAWMALDRCDEANGCMQVVPGSHTWPLLCATEADTDASMSDVTVPLPAGCEMVSVHMEPGDVMFFNGSLVHGSEPNTTTDRFRRSLIAHYVDAHAEELTRFALPALGMDGREVHLRPSPGGGWCGGWKTIDGEPVIVKAGELATESIAE